jgi:hypothetical protein
MPSGTFQSRRQTVVRDEMRRKVEIPLGLLSFDARYDSLGAPASTSCADRL